MLDRFSIKSVIASVLFRTTKSVVMSLMYKMSVSWFERTFNWAFSKKKRDRHLPNLWAIGINACQIGMSRGMSRLFPMMG